MKTHLLLTSFSLTVLLFLAAPVAQAQANFSGTFCGNVTQNSGGLSDNYDMVMDLTVKGHKVKGTTTFFMPGEKKELVTYKCEGTVKGKYLELHETETLHAQNINGYFCFKDMEMELKGGTITGTWTSTNCKTAKGVITLKDCNDSLSSLY